MIDGAGHRKLSKFFLFPNGTACESNSYFGLVITVKSYLQMRKDDLKTVGKNMYYKDISTKIHDLFAAAFFVNHSQDKTDIQAERKDGIQMMVPLEMEMSSAGIFLMNGVDIILRFDWCPPNLLIGVADETAYKYRIQSAKFWNKIVVAYLDALFSLNKSLINTNSNIENILERPML